MGIAAVSEAPWRAALWAPGAVSCQMPAAEGRSAARQSMGRRGAPTLRLLQPGPRLQTGGSPAAPGTPPQG